MARMCLKAATIAFATGFAVSAAAQVYTPGTVLNDGNVFLLQSLADTTNVDGTWVGIPTSEGVVGGVVRQEATNTLSIEKLSPSSSGTEIRSGDTVAIRGTGGCDCSIFVPRPGAVNDDVQATPSGGTTANRSFLVIRKVDIISGTRPSYQIAANGADILAGDFVILRDTAGDDFRLNLPAAPSTMKAVATDDEATPFKIQELQMRWAAGTIPTTPEWVEIGWTDAPPCTKLEWRNDGFLGIPAPTYKEAGQKWHAYAKYDAAALNQARTAIGECLVNAGAAATIASIVSSPAGAAPTFNTAFTACASAKKIAANLTSNVVELKVESVCGAWR